MGYPTLQSLHLCKQNKHNIIDHKPLQPLFSGKSLTSCSPRTARLLLKVIETIGMSGSFTNRVQVCIYQTLCLG